MSARVNGAKADTETRYFMGIKYQVPKKQASSSEPIQVDTYVYNEPSVDVDKGVLRNRVTVYNDTDGYADLYNNTDQPMKVGVDLLIQQRGIGERMEHFDLNLKPHKAERLHMHAQGWSSALISAFADYTNYLHGITIRFIARVRYTDPKTGKQKVIEKSVNTYNGYALKEQYSDSLAWEP